MLKVIALGCGPSGAVGNPPTHRAPYSVVTASLGGVPVSTLTADALGEVFFDLPSAGTYTISGVDPDGTLSGTMTKAVTCGPTQDLASLLMTAVAGHNCLDGVLYRPLETTLQLTDAQGTRTLTHGANLRGLASSDFWDCCATVSSTHLEGGGCAQTTGNVRMMYEFNSLFNVGTGLWKPKLSQVWLANACSLPDYYTILSGGSCPPPNPSGGADFSSSYARLATVADGGSWSAGPPFTASFTFPTDASVLGAMSWLPMAGTVTVSEV